MGCGILARLALVLALSQSPARVLATTVVPPDFDSLIRQADFVVRAVVTKVTSEWRVDGPHRHIITKVAVEVREVITGAPPAPLVLELLGGRVGEDELRVEGAPGFAVGNEAVLFVHGNGRQFIPLVALSYGQFPIAHDPRSGQDYVLRSNGRPLTSVSEVVTPLGSPVARVAARALTAAEFAAQIRISAPQKAPTAHAN